MRPRMFLLAAVVSLLSVSCGSVSELPAVSHPNDRGSVSRGYSVLVQETHEHETAFVVTLPPGAKADYDALLAIAKELHQERGERYKTAVIFQAHGKTAQPQQPLAEQYAHAFAVGIMDDVKRHYTVQFGTFN